MWRILLVIFTQRATTLPIAMHEPQQPQPQQTRQQHGNQHEPQAPNKLHNTPPKHLPPQHPQQQPRLLSNHIPCKEVTFTTSRERVTGPVDGTSWCHNRITPSLPSFKFIKTDQETCESFYIDPVNFVILPDYGFDCTGGCAPCAYTNDSQTGWGCMQSNTVYRCTNPTRS